MKGYGFLEDALGDSFSRVVANTSGHVAAATPGTPVANTGVDDAPPPAPKSANTLLYVIGGIVLAMILFGDDKPKRNRNPYDESELFDPSVDFPEA